MLVGILGSGFGLYGYLPALVRLGHNVVTLERYRSNILKRNELTDFIQHVDFLETDQQIVSQASCVVIARNPSSQVDLVQNQLTDLKLKQHVFLEKPLTDLLETRQSFINTLRVAGMSFSVAYLFLYSEWFNHLKSQESGEFEVNWVIAKPKAEWKNSTRQGGGLLNYYLIHFLPCFDELFLNFQIKQSFLSREHSIFVASGKILLKVKVTLSDTESNFSVTTNSSHSNKVLFSAKTPFGPLPCEGILDPRIDYLERYIHENLTYAKGESESLRLEELICSQIEALTQHI
jgi:hypothetical protein